MQFRHAQHGLRPIGNRIRDAQLPRLKTLEEFDFGQAPQIPAAKTLTVPEKNGAYVGWLDVPPVQQDSKPLLATTIGPTYVQPEGAGTGQLLFLRDGTLMALPFNAHRLELTGVPEPVAGAVFSLVGKGMFSASPGVLPYRNAIADSQLTWLDRGGRVIGTVGEAGRLQSLALSPDGRRVADADPGVMIGLEKLNGWWRSWRW